MPGIEGQSLPRRLRTCPASPRSPIEWRVAAPSSVGCRVVFLRGPVEIGSARGGVVPGSLPAWRMARATVASIFGAGKRMGETGPESRITHNIWCKILISTPHDVQSLRHVGSASARSDLLQDVAVCATTKPRRRKRMGGQSKPDGLRCRGHGFGWLEEGSRGGRIALTERRTPHLPLQAAVQRPEFMIATRRGNPVGEAKTLWAASTGTSAQPFLHALDLLG